MLRWISIPMGLALLGLGACSSAPETPEYGSSTLPTTQTETGDSAADGSAGTDSASSSTTDASSSTTDDSSSSTTDDSSSSTTDDSTTGDSSSGPLLDVGGMTGSTTMGGDGTGGDLGCEKVDLLFVIDDSASMSDNQDKLTNAFPSFMQTVDQELVIEKGIDYRVGVVSAEMAGESMCLFGVLCADGHRGRLQHGPDRLDCNDVPDGRWIETGPVDDVAAEFTCIASMVGQDFRESPLEAMRASLVDRVNDAEAYNAGFLRADALLVVVIITDEDDQSVWMVPEMWNPLNPFELGPASPVIDYWNQLVDLKGGEPSRIVTLGITAPENSDCGGTSEDPDGVASPRLHEFMGYAEPNSYWTNICENDYTSALQEALDVIEASCDEFVPID